ncbi:MAG: ROK family protein [Melioribacteraceae bacterium]|nr:ROK family protein [Melioribacteraceae bacterium]
MEIQKIISVDLGGTNILSALIINGKIEHRVKIPTDVTGGVEYLVTSIAGSVRKIIEETGTAEQELKSICLGVPGTVDPSTGIIAHAPNLGITNYNIKEALQTDFNVPILIENDVNIAALGIKVFEFQNEVNNMLVIFVGTGIGGALLFDGNLYRGSSNYAGEIGHMKVNEEGRFSGSNKFGKSTLENLASRTAIVKAIKKDLKRGAKSVLNETTKPNERIKSKVLSNALDSKDKLVTYHMKKAARVIGTVSGSLATLLNFDTVVIGGGVVEASPKFMIKHIQKSFQKAVLPEPGKDVKIVSTVLGDDAPLYGGIALTEEFIRD